MPRDHIYLRCTLPYITIKIQLLSVTMLKSIEELLLTGNDSTVIIK